MSLSLEAIKNQRKSQREYQRRKRALFREKLYEIKSQPCVDCKEQYPHYVMDFDHVRGNKISGVSQMVNKVQKNWNLVLEEIKKCDLVCANCHRKRTHSRNQYVKRDVE